jgi:uncharacterized repeat protein (TIGR03803 family)
VPISGGAPTTLATFDGGNGIGPYGTLIAVGSTLYGTTASGGASDDGTVFSLPITGGNPTTLATFSGSNGWVPFAGLTVVGSTLYGTTEYGGDLSLDDGMGYGTVFSVPITGGSPTTLATFDYGNGDNVRDSLIAVGSTLYGTTELGGSDTYPDSGTVFSLPITGGALTTMATFPGDDGGWPDGLTVIGDTIYGTNRCGGPNGGDGTVFSLPITGGDPSTLVYFIDSNGSGPDPGLTAVGNVLYDTTETGGTYGNGTVFELSLPEPASLSLLALGSLALLPRRRRIVG